MSVRFVVPLAMLLSASATYAAEYLTNVDSEVFTTTGTQSEITERAATCIAQTVKPGTVSTPLIISKNADTGIIVANDGFSYTHSFIKWDIRTTLTFEAKDARFRVRHTNIERFVDEWQRVGKWSGSSWKSVEAAIQSVSSSVAQCVQRPAQSSNW